MNRGLVKVIGCFTVSIVFLFIYNCDEVGEDEYSDILGTYVFTITNGDELYTGSFVIGDQDDGNFSGTGVLNISSELKGFNLSGEIDKSDHVGMSWSVVNVQIYSCMFTGSGFLGKATGSTWSDAIFEAVESE